MDQILPDAVPCGSHASEPSFASPPTLMNMDTINKLSSVDNDSATLIADNQGSTTLVSRSDAGASQAVGHKGDDDSMQIDDVDVSSHVGDKCLPPGSHTPSTSPSISSHASKCKYLTLLSATSLSGLHTSSTSPSPSQLLSVSDVSDKKPSSSTQN